MAQLLLLCRSLGKAYFQASSLSNYKVALYSQEPRKKAQLTCGKKELVKVIFEGAVKKTVFAMVTLDVATVFETAGE